jgi:hypothetical protein
MTKGILLAALVAATFTAALLTHVGQSSASFHLQRIDGAMAGANGNSTIQYVELRSANIGQNFVGTRAICFYDSAGAPYAEFKFPANVANGADGASILVGTAEFDAAWPAGAPDFTFTGNTTAIALGADTDHPMRSPGGKISFGSDATLTPSMMCQGSFFQVDSVVYGTAAYGGIVDYGTQLASDLPTSSTMSLHLQGPVCIELSAHLCTSPRDNHLDYAIVDENATGNQPTNNGGLSGPIVTDSDGDGVPDTLDLCPGTAPGAIVDANGCSQAQVDRDADGICDPGAPSAGPAPGCTGSDNCPDWPNPAQNLPVWTVPAGDTDCDGFPNTVKVGSKAAESFIGTDPARHCAATSMHDDEPLPDAWPFDFNDDQLAGLADVSKYSSVFGSHSPGPPYAVRFDLNGDGLIGLGDVAQFSSTFGKRCA